MLKKIRIILSIISIILNLALIVMIVNHRKRKHDRIDTGRIKFPLPHGFPFAEDPGRSESCGLLFSAAKNTQILGRFFCDFVYYRPGYFLQNQEGSVIFTIKTSLAGESCAFLPAIVGREDTAMELQPSLTVSQKLTLTPAMRQALRCLQLPIPELSELLQEEALSNPLLNAEPPEHTARETLSAPEIREDSIWRVGGQRDPEEDRTDNE